MSCADCGGADTTCADCAHARFVTRFAAVEKDRENLQTIHLAEEAKLRAQLAALEQRLTDRVVAVANQRNAALTERDALAAQVAKMEEEAEEADKAPRLSAEALSSSVASENELAAMVKKMEADRDARTRVIEELVDKGCRGGGHCPYWEAAARELLKKGEP